MCVHYEPATYSELRALQAQLDESSPSWPADTWQDYAAPIIVRQDGGGRRALVASYGMIPKRKIPPGVKKFTTMNARSETVGSLRSYSKAWKAGQLCLVPMRRFFEPNWETGVHISYGIGMADASPFAVAGLWRAWEEEGGVISHSFTQLTVNADEHPVMKHFHKLDDEKRSLVIVAPADYDAWLACADPEQARSFMTLYPSHLLKAVPAPIKPKATPDLLS